MQRDPVTCHWAYQIAPAALTWAKVLSRPVPTGKLCLCSGQSTHWSAALYWDQGSGRHEVPLACTQNFEACSMLGVDSGKEAQLGRSLWLHSLKMSRTCGVVHCCSLLGNGGGSTWVMAISSSLHRPGWCPRSIWVLVWLYFWPLLLPSTR